MKSKPNLFVSLTIIYLALLIVCIAIYAILQLYVKELDTATVTNLMIWSATLFPSIALLYTFNEWRNQKGSEVLSKKFQDIFIDFHLYNTNIITSLLIFQEALINKKSIDKFFEKDSMVTDSYIKIEKELSIISIYNKDLILIYNNFQKLYKEYLSIIHFKNHNSISSEDIKNYDGDTQHILDKSIEHIKNTDEFKTLIEKYCIKYIFYQDDKSA